RVRNASVPLIRFFDRSGSYRKRSMKIRFLASTIVAAFFVLNCWAQNAPASTPPPNSFLERLTPYRFRLETMDGTTVCNHGAHPRCGDARPECIQHACVPHGQYRSAAQWFVAG